nr:IS1 family transposase [Escherichia coli]
MWFAGRGTAPEWQMKREMLSQCYTTKWRDIPLARLGRKSLSFSKSVELHDKVIGHYLNIKHYQ